MTNVTSIKVDYCSCTVAQMTLMLLKLMLLIQLGLKRAEIISKMDEGCGNTGHVTRTVGGARAQVRCS